MAWKQLKDFDGTICGFSMTVRVTKNDDSVKPIYSVAIGTRNDPQPFRPFLRGDILSMVEETKVPGVTRSGTSVLYGLQMQAAAFMDADRKEHVARLEHAESERRAALAGKRGGDPKAGTGLSRFSKPKKPDTTDST